MQEPMRKLLAVTVVALSVTAAATSSALPPNESGRGFREGVNHHVGDDGFRAREGRAPRADDGEAQRMKDHLTYVRAWLAARPATRPELSAMRARLFGYLDDYIADGITPKNEHLAWRSPVFIDDGGAICAVGYLVERTAGRSVAEKIAAAHRYDLLEDIAAAMPEVRAWIDASGFTLEEFASIQPGYDAPVVETWKAWADDEKHTDGPFEEVSDTRETSGSFKNGWMDGEWTTRDAEKRLVGSGVFVAGAGAWKSTYADGARMAEGPFARNRPHGIWRFFHPSGHLAAIGRFDQGVRGGFWQFFQDEARLLPIAEGTFIRGTVAGMWRHFDASGVLLATSRDATPTLWRDSFGGYLLDVFPGKDGVHHWVHEGNIMGDLHRLDMFFDGSEVVYDVWSYAPDRRLRFDATGHALERDDHGWTARDCHFRGAALRAAVAGDVVTLHGFIDGEGQSSEAPKCDDERKPVPAWRAKHLDAMLGGADKVRALTPEFVRKMALEGRYFSSDAERDAQTGDLAKIIASNMTWYVEWPHVDGRFIHVFETLPGYAVKMPGT
jgi:hypothetical protein